GGVGRRGGLSWPPVSGAPPPPRGPGGGWRTISRPPVADREHPMPIQTFEPMTKDFPTFDCDAHITEPPLIWERASEFLTREEMEALRATIWWDNDTQQLIVDGKAGVGIGSPRPGGTPRPTPVISAARPGPNAALP